MRKSSVVLIVDKDKTGRTKLAHSLRQGGHRVKTADEGEQALELLRRESFDVLITEARLGPMDGFQLSFRAKRVLPGLRILMISAEFSEEDIKDFPINHFLSKPVPTGSLLDWLAAGKS